MAFLVSPGVNTSEVDQTNTVPATSTSIGAYAGHFNWGPSGDIVTVGSEKELADYFGAPAHGNTSRSFLTAASFLKYSNELRVSRAIGSTAYNAADSNPIQILNKDHFDTLTNLDFAFSARYPGSVGNSLKVSYVHVSGDSLTAYNNWPYRGLFDSAPNQSLTAQANGIGSNDEIHLVVIDELGLFTGTKGAILEKFEGLSLGANAKNEDGGSIYYRDVINGTSSYIYVNSLSEVFAEADTDITEDSEFIVEDGSTSAYAKVTLPFSLRTEVSTSFGGGSPQTVTTETASPLDIIVGSVGPNGNNTKINVRYIPTASAPAKKARAVIVFGTPANGDTVVVNGTTFTKAANGTGANFNTIADLAADISGVSGVTATVFGTRILVEATAAGTAGNSITLVRTGTGSLTVSGATLTGGLAAADENYFISTVDVLDANTGYVTYDLTLSAEVSGSELIAKVGLASILAELNTLSQLNSIPLLTVKNAAGTTILATDAIASGLFIDLTEVVSFTGVNQPLLRIVQFAGGDVVNYLDETYISSVSFTGGTNGAIAPGNVVTALDIFGDKEVVDINLLFSEAFDDDQDVVDAAVYEIANSRKDILAAISAPIGIASLTSNAQKKAAVIAKFDGVVYTSSSYVTFDETPVYTYNKYADKYVWIPAAGHMAGLCANADFVADPWFSPAGFNRGQLKGVTKIAYNPSESERNDLYKKRINSIISLPGQGVVLYGDKTALSKPSAFGFINVRRLFNVLERSISIAAKYQLFELNDEFTRASFKNTIEPFLRDVQGRRGITDFRVVCDDTNNTDQVIDNNEFVGDIYVKPARSINYIQLNFIATRTGIDFKEIVGA